MVTAESLWYNPIPINASEQWWQDIQPALTSFYDIVENFSAESSRSEILMWMIECHDSASFIQQMSAPADVASARCFLIEAFSDLTKSLAFFVAGDDDRSRACWHSAQIEFEFVQESIFAHMLQ